MCIFTVKLKIILDGFRIAQFLQQLIMDCLVGNTVQKYNQLQAPVYNAVIKYA